MKALRSMRMKVSVAVVLTSAFLGGVSCKLKLSPPPATGASTAAPTTSAFARGAPSGVAPSKQATTEPSPAATREAGDGFLGVVVALNPSAGALGNVSGVRVARIQDGSPASRSQLKLYDVIHAVNAQPIVATGSPIESFRDAIAGCSPGQTITMDVVRAWPDGEPKHFTVEVQLGKRPAGGIPESLPDPNWTLEQVTAGMTRLGFKLTSTSGDPRVKGSEVWTKADAQLTVYYIHGKVEHTMELIASP